MTAIAFEMESYRRILGELVRQVEEQEHARSETAGNKPRISTHNIDEKIQKLESHIHALSQATKHNSEAHRKLLVSMQRVMTVVEYDGQGDREARPKIGMLHGREAGNELLTAFLAASRIRKGSSSSSREVLGKRYNLRRRSSQSHKRMRSY